MTTKDALEKITECKCNFKPPHPLRKTVGKIYGMYTINNKSYLSEFFCFFCRGLITNDKKYIEEVIKYNAKKYIEFDSDEYAYMERAKKLLGDYQYLLKSI